MGSLQVVVLGPVVDDGGAAVLELERYVEQVGHGAAHRLPRVGLDVEDEEPSPASAEQFAAERAGAHAALVQGVDGAGRDLRAGAALEAPGGVEQPAELGEARRLVGEHALGHIDQRQHLL